MRLHRTFKFTHYDMELITDAVLYINNNYPNYYSAEMLAMEVMMDIKKLQAGFKKNTGFTVHQYQINLRLLRSKIDLEDSKLSVKLITSKHGFKTSSQFCKLFKKHVGQTPMQYRTPYIEYKQPSYSS